jgi:hypothetical protein
MKKSASYQTIDGYDIVTAIRESTIDPAQTMKAVNALVEALPETAQVKSITAKIIAQQNIMQEENAKATAKRLANPQADISAEEARHNQAKANIEVEEQNLKPVLDAINAARLSLFEEAALCFPPGPGEKHLSPAEEADLVPKWAALGKHEALTLTGDVIPFMQGAEYWEKDEETDRWAKTKIAVVGEALPDGAILPDSLTPGQRAEIAAQDESDRIAALNPEAKEAEKNARLDEAADEADRLSRRALIQGKSFDAAAWYAEKQDGIEAKYG